MTNNEDFYSFSELLGNDPSENFWEETYYSEEEVEEITDLFSDFYSENEHLYTDVDKAYSDFLHAYRELTTTYASDDEPKRLSPMQSDIIMSGAGAGLGYGTSRIATIKLRKEIKKLQDLVDGGRATRDEFAKLKKLKTKLSSISGAATVAGAVTGLAGMKLARKYKDTKNSDDSYSTFQGRALGAGVGYGIGALSTKSSKKEIKSIESKSKLTDADKAKLEYLKQKRQNAKTQGAAVGFSGSSTASGAGLLVGHKLTKSKQDKFKELMLLGSKRTSDQTEEMKKLKKEITIAKYGGIAAGEVIHQAHNARNVIRDNK